MVGSFRRRILAIAALTVLACAAAITAILYLARTTLDERTAHDRDNVVREVERLRGALEAVPPQERAPHEHQSGELRGGYVVAPETLRAGPRLAEAIARAAAGQDVVVLDAVEEAGAPVVVAAAPVRGGGFAYAQQRVVAGRETRSLRVVVVVLALLTAALVVASLRTLAAVQKGVSALRASLSALAGDLRAPVARPSLSELADVASGIATLAQELDRAQQEHERLERDLAGRERLAALGRVVAGVAHEVRNPLAAMKLRADLARTGGEATPAVARDLEDISSEIARLDRLVSDLLFVAGRRQGPRAEVDLGELVGRRVALLAPWATDKRGVRLDCDGAARARVDADAVARAVDNLLRNAVEASDAGATVAVHVRADGQGAAVVVEDRGPGVPPDRAAELFEPFFTTKPDGTGLGLALARAVAAAHEGNLAYTREGDTTRFTLKLG